MAAKESTLPKVRVSDNLRESAERRAGELGYNTLAEYIRYLVVLDCTGEKVGKKG